MIDCRQALSFTSVCPENLYSSLLAVLMLCESVCLGVSVVSYFTHDDCCKKLMLYWWTMINLLSARAKNGWPLWVHGPFFFSIRTKLRCTNAAFSSVWLPSLPQQRSRHLHQWLGWQINLPAFRNWGLVETISLIVGGRVCFACYSMY